MDKGTLACLLQKLVSIPSVNPALLNDPNLTGEERLADFLMQWGKANALECERFEAQKGRPCVLLSTGLKASSSPTLLCSAHMDTVWTPAMEEPFKLKAKGNRLHGLGAVDNKGSLTAALAALLELKDKELSCRFQVLCTCDEEWGLAGIKTMIPEHARPDAAIVMEGTELKLVAAHKGSCRFTITVRGKSVHSSLVSQGDNAIYKAARLISALEHYAQKLLLSKKHPLLGTSTLSVVTIHGGKQPSAIPDECSFIINWRTLPSETLASVTSQLRRVLDATKIKYEVASRSFDASHFEMDPDHPWLRTFQEVLIALKLDPEPYGVPYAAEAAITHHAGIPTVMFGPGAITTAHSADEAISLEAIITAAQVLVAAAVKFGAGSCHCERVGGIPI
ncbi:MAG: M20 family peptidase [Verrucomicrobiae bacterium]|nr:M20 family peptidase [Verrucomicrobiae bacterium]